MWAVDVGNNRVCVYIAYDESLGFALNFLDASSFTVNSIGAFQLLVSLV